jgi:hypothetical protein
MPIIIIKDAEDNRIAFDADVNIFSIPNPDSTRLFFGTQRSPASVASEYTIPHFFRD